MGTFHRIARQQGGTALELYVRDVELAAAFMADLALLEVVLRNAMNDQLSGHFGRDWFRQDGLFDERSRSAIKRMMRARFRLVWEPHRSQGMMGNCI